MDCIKSYVMRLNQKSYLYWLYVKDFMKFNFLFVGIFCKKKIIYTLIPFGLEK